MYCIVEQRVLPRLSEEEREQLLTQAYLHTLVEMLEAIPDPRGKHGLRYDLPYLLTCLIAALLCNCQSTEAVSQWCREHLDLLQDLFGPRLFFTPSGSLYRWLLPQINAEAVERVLSTWVRATSLASATDPLAVDGKTVRGARTAERDAPHLLSCFTHQSKEVWAELAVGEKTNEIPEARKLLPTLPIGGRVSTFDALHSHRQRLPTPAVGASVSSLRDQRQRTHTPSRSGYLLCRSACSVPAGRDDRSPTRAAREAHDPGRL